MNLVSKLKTMHGHNASVYGLSSDKNRERFWTADGNGWIVEWINSSCIDGNLIARIDDSVYTLSWLQEGHLAAGTKDGRLWWIKINESAAEFSKWYTHKGGVFFIKLIGDYIYSGGGDGVLTKWSLNSKMPLESVKLSESSLRSVAYHSMEKKLFVGGSDGNIYVIGLESFKMLNIFVKAHASTVFSLLVNEGGNRLISGGKDAKIQIWSLDGYHEMEIAAHLNSVYALAWLDNESVLVSASRDKTIKLWKHYDFENFKLIKVLEGLRDSGHIRSINNMIAIGQLNWITTGDDRSVIEWKLNNSL